MRLDNPLRDRQTEARSRTPSGDMAAVQPVEDSGLIVGADAGAGIGWHRDRPQFGRVVGVTLLGSATLRFRQRTGSGFRRASLELAPRSAYLLSGEVREQWEHGIAAHDVLRYSITLRTARSPRA